MHNKISVLDFPVTITIFGQKILLHVIFELLAFFIGFRYYLYLRKRQADIISSENRVWILIGATFGALIGSRLVGGLENPEALKAAANPLLYFYKNKTVLGGFLGGLAGVELIKKVIGEKQKSGDLFTYPIILALIIGRVGCFTMGVHEETYGIATKLFTGMNLGDGLLRHPVTLYEIAFLIFLWTVLRYSEKRYQFASGGIFKLLMIAYCMFRFLLDFIKPHNDFVLNLSAIQLTSLLGLLYYLPFIIQPKKLLQAYA